MARTAPVKDKTPQNTTLAPKAPQNAHKPPTEVILKSADGKPEWDVLTDGLARGYPNDNKYMRMMYRTPSALRRILEKKHDAAARFPGMETLPVMYMITSQGQVSDLNGNIIAFDDRPDWGKTINK